MEPDARGSRGAKSKQTKSNIDEDMMGSDSKSARNWTKHKKR